METPVPLLHEGGCLCRDVRYRVSGAPLRTMVCHCTFCQRFTGSSFYAESLFLQEQVTFRGGPLHTYEHRSDGSGKIVTLHFCPRCATTVSLTFERSPQIRGISRGTFDDPGWAEVQAHIFTRSARKDTVLPAGVLCYEGHRITLDSQPLEGRIFDRPTPVDRRT